MTARTRSMKREPLPVFVVVPDLKTASEITRNLPGIRVGVLQYRDD
jgi:hypothetical protein